MSSTSKYNVNNNLLKLVVYLIGLVIKLAIHRLLTPRSIFNSLSVMSLVIAGTAFATPIWQQLIERFVLSEIPPPYCSLPANLAGLIFIILTFVFALLSHSVSRKATPESLIEMKAISPSICIANARIFCYCGTVLTLSEAEVVVTSENTELDLGSFRGTSMSGRMRRAAAEFHVDGTLLHDHLHESVTKWRRSQGTNGPYSMGTCFPSPPFNASAQGIKSIIHAIAIEKNGDGSRRVDATAIRKIVLFVLDYCQKENYRSVFIPIFGIGSSKLNASEIALLTVAPLMEFLSRSNFNVDVYLGTYRISDAALVGKLLLEASSATR